MKSWLTSKTLWLNGILLIGSLLALSFGFLPAEYAGYAAGAVAVLNIVLRFLSNGAVSIALPGNVPAVPAVLQAAINAFEQVAAALPTDLGPRALELVEIAAGEDLLSNDGRFYYVLSRLQTEYPGLGTNILRTCIEQLVMAKNEGAALPLVVVGVSPLCTGCGPEVTPGVKAAAPNVGATGGSPGLDSRLRGNDGSGA